jgi:hypothetical protein
MTPEEAREHITWSAARPAARHRYALEGGTRREFICLKCGCATAAHSPDEAGANLTEYGRHRLEAALCLGDHAIAETGHLMPPIDFS